ncbi:MAG: hypothetical protein ABIJ35_02415 [Acidobacteriota bacterium]
MKDQCVRSLAVACLAFVLFTASDCDLLTDNEPFVCAVQELRPNPDRGYYDLIVEVKRISLADPGKDRFSVETPMQSLALKDLTFIEEGEESEYLEPGDVFIVPLRRPDWKFFIRDHNDIYCSHNFWEELPDHDQWHPTKSEAMAVAESLVLEMSFGLPLPEAQILPNEWRLAEEEDPASQDPCGFRLYQKIRASEVKEKVLVTFCYLTDAEMRERATLGGTVFLTGWTEWTRKFGRSCTISGHEAVCWDMPGIGEHGWSYRYAYIDTNVLLEIDLEADPREWIISDEDKRNEGRTRAVFLQYGYGPEGEAGWQIMISLRKNGEGTFFKRSSRGITIQKDFLLTDNQLQTIYQSLADNRIRELESRSGPPGGQESFLSILEEDTSHVVRVRNFSLPPYEAVASLIRSIVLPLVDEV